MKIKTVKNKISLEGELIIENAEEGKQLLLSAMDKVGDARSVTLDLGKVKEIDSSGFQLLLAFIRTLQNRDIDFKMKKVREEVFNLVELAGLNKFFKIHAADVVKS